MKSKDNYKVIGVMSGTSMDGLDIACCLFTRHKRKWKYIILDAETLPYSSKWKEALSGAPLLSPEDLLALDAAYGKFIGDACMSFIRKHKVRHTDFISSHGHTVFHQPDHGFTFQIGNGNSINAATDLPVIYDFRSLDVALKGQGAPLVPAGDRYLFGEFDVCINLGGIANISLEKNKKRLAFDVCYLNMGLNFLAGEAGLSFDKDGALAAKGKVNKTLLKALDKIYKPLRKTRPSLGREGFERDVEPLLSDRSLSVEDRLRTFCEAAANEITVSIYPAKGKLKILVTGGGAFNPVVMDLLRSKMKNSKMTAPPKDIIEFKEALIFAFLGVLRMRGEVNVLKTVTGATRDSSSGVIIGK